MIQTITQERLQRVARAHGLRTRGGRFGPGRGKVDWQIHRDQHGWLSIKRPAAGDANRCRVVDHADWAGPIKWMADLEGPVQRIDVLLGSQFDQRFDAALLPAAEDGFDRVLSGVLEQAHAIFCQDRSVLDTWQPPGPKQLSTWLTQAGMTVATDKDENLRMTIRAARRVGQVRVLVRTGQLRLVMPLGDWSGLSDAAEAAMLNLADQANNRLRLARIAWRSRPNGGRRCEAQVDLTGLLWSETSDGADGGILPDMARVAIDGLELALRYLQSELDVLADPRHQDLAEMVFFDSVQ